MRRRIILAVGCLLIAGVLSFTRDTTAYHAKVKASQATQVTAVLKNEFGELSFSFRAPDGHSWALVGK